MTLMRYYCLLLSVLLGSLALSQDKLTNSKKNTLPLGKADHAADYKKQRYLLKYVNPFIGTGGHGHTYPGASAPFGMMQLSPDTRYQGWDGCSGYHYSDSVIYGFSHTHLSGTGVEDYCDLLIVPQTGEPKTIPGYLNPEKGGYGSTFSHQKEKASPGYYAVELDNGIKAELTTAQRSGIHRYTFPKNGQKRSILIDLTHRDKLLKFGITQLSKREVSGVRISSSWAKEQHLYFFLQTSVDVVRSQLIDDGAKLLLEFPETVETIELRVGISAVDEKGAQNNLEKELTEDQSFQSVKNSTEELWLKELSAVIIDTMDQDQTTNFYTALYHSYLAPNLFSDLDGRYRGLDGKIHQSNKNANQYTVFSLWDTYRATHPWYTLFQKERTYDFITTFENQFLHSGDLPVWELAGNETHCMIGYHSASVIADAYMKGLKQIDVPLFIHALETTANLDEFGRSDFNNQGFINCKKEPESVSKTLEYAYDSYCIYTFLSAAKQEGFTVKDSLINVFYKRSFNFINSFDPQTGFMRPRHGGIWHSPFKPEEVNFHYTEANSWQYSLYAPHAIPVLSQLLGGPEGLKKWLDNLFSASSKLAGNSQADITGLIGQYAHGNEPSHHIAYLYNYTGSPEKTAVIVDSILYHYYHNAPDGLSGNEDCGQMSSWFVFSSLGLYPVSPGTGIYDFGRPLFKSADLRLENNKQIRITAVNNSRTNKYIQGIQVDGKPFKKRYITQAELEGCKSIEFTMGPYPSAEYRTYEIAPSIDSLPPSFVAVPYFTNQSTSFEKQTTIGISSVEKDLTFYYTLDGSTPTNQSKKYKKPFKIKQGATVKAISYNPQTKQSSEVIANDFHPKPEGINLSLKSSYQPQYAASGDGALIDGLFGTNEFRSGDWQGFYNMDVIGVVTFQKGKSLKKIGLSTLQSTRSWIFPPKSVEFTLVYEDGTTETSIIDLKEHPEAGRSPEQSIRFEFQPTTKPVKSIEFKAINYGVNPEWHLSPGYPTYIFLDELYFE